MPLYIWGVNSARSTITLKVPSVLSARKKSVASRSGCSLYSTLPSKPRWSPNGKFDPTAIENGWYEYWDSRGFFEPPKEATKSQVRMLLPPPNVTGQLHIGHALMISIQDSLARYYRMQGHVIKWSPGTDHAGIATQSVVERMLEQERGITRVEIGRDSFLKEAELWREKCGRRILEQIKVIGASTTNSQEYYTKDKQRSTAVTNAFVKLWEEGLIYRSTRIVNWCVKLRTAVSDIEVKMHEICGPKKIEGAEFGVLHKFVFKLTDGDGCIEVATTRPETIPGDRAIAVHPDDERYKHLHYKLVQHPLLPDVTLPIVPDAELVDPAFGTGAVKITPAHDCKDYAFWTRHSSNYNAETSSHTHRKSKIPIVKVISETGKMRAECGIESLVGRDRLRARSKVVAMLQECGSYRGKENHKMSIGICERSGAVIEPMLQPQWYLKTKPLAENVFRVAKRDGLGFVPSDPHRVHWEHWLSGIQDWCLSRQIWWGHQIPAYMVIDPYKNGHIERWLVAESIEDAERNLTMHEREKGYLLKQDTDVLDTWFSSGLLPLSTASWTGKSWSQKKRDNYPLRFIESGDDILLFWLARMAMLCTWFTDKLPFKEVILHPIVCDSKGRKMSKSVGNVIDPLLIVNGRLHSEMVTDLQEEFKELVNQPGERGIKAAKLLRGRITELRRNHPKGFIKSGADSLRMALVDYTRRYTRINMETHYVDCFRKLAIKIENAFKFYYHTRFISGPHFTPLPLGSVLSDFRLHDKLLLFRLQNLIVAVEKAFMSRKLYEATAAIREFIFETYCSMYLEFIKQDLATESSDVHRRNVALSILTASWDVILRLLHPFMPFLTESLWQELDPKNRAEIETASIVISAFPSANDIPTIKESEFRDMRIALRLIDSLRDYGRSKKGDIRVTMLPFDIAIPDGPEGEYIRDIFSIVKAVSKAPGANATDYIELQERLIDEQNRWQTVWVGLAKTETRGKKSWKVWENQDTEHKIFVWCEDEIDEVAKLRTLFLMIGEA